METSTPQDTAPANATGAAGGARTAGSVPTRRVSFEDSLAELPVHFAADGDLILSHFFAAMSSVFPDGEEFFVRSVRRFRDQITDPELRSQVAGFIGQESVHGREHRALNARLAELGYPTRRYEWLTRRSLGIRERIATDRANLDIAYAYASRLQGETADGEDGLHFHPAEPRLFRLSLARRF